MEYKITEEQRDALLRYLKGKIYNEVAQGVHMLENLEKIEPAQEPKE